ncbi:hypothetical protein H5410_043448 [Solanum commersonii]|uniref:Uncharacterized protein n=1 Tax=Solanum commersonii TaxID=4109 RepID=A0A9J5Y1F8_SOLCO|nr:hypothetical protein H5410_043448 [Solanum commersonii]
MLMFFDDLTDGTSWFLKLDKYLIMHGMVWNFPTLHLTGKLLDTSLMNFGKLENNLRVSYYCRRGCLPLCYVSANDQFFPIDLVLNLEVTVNKEYAEHSLLSPEITPVANCMPMFTMAVMMKIPKATMFINSSLFSI